MTRDDRTRLASGLGGLPGCGQDGVVAMDDGAPPAPRMSWQPGDVVVRREIAWGRPWLACPVFVVADTTELLATYLAQGAPFGYLPGWPHPWYPQPAWYGHGVLMLQRPGEDYAVWHFWEGPDRAFARWYLNFQEPFRRTAIGYDTQDLELDVVIGLDRSCRLKDADLVEQRVREGRFTSAVADRIRAEAERIIGDVAAGRTWWDDEWASWEPDPAWVAPELPAGWEDVRPRG